MDLRRWARAALLLAALLAAPGAVAHANDSAMGGAGGAVKPVGSTTIRMGAETVQVVAFERYAEYQVDFQFENTGAPQHVKLGFPFPLPFEDGEYTPPAGFRAWQGDTPLPVTYQEVKEGDWKLGYYLHEADFPTGKTMVRVRYYAAPDTSVGSPPPNLRPPERFAGSSSFLGFYPYTVSTGAGWAGTIGTSVIRYYISPDALVWGVNEAAKQAADRMQPNDVTGVGAAKQKDAAAKLLSYTTPAPGVYEWRFTDFEPTPSADGSSPYDIALPFYIPTGIGSKAPSWAPQAGVKASSELTLGQYKYPAFQAVDGDPSSAWAEGAPGSGTGQSLTVTFPASRQVREIRVLPGYAKNEALFRKYNRPRTLNVEFSDGTSKLVDLADEPTLQRFPVSANATWAKVTIGDVYRGTTGDETYLSEIEFGTAKAPEVMPFTDVLDGKVAAPGEVGGAAGATTSTPGSDGTLRFPEQWRDPGWPLFACCVGCGVLLGLVIGAVLVLVMRKRGKSAGPAAVER